MGAAGFVRSLSDKEDESINGTGVDCGRGTGQRMAKFEDQLAKLETVVEKLERGELSLDESVRLFEEGVKLSEACKQELEKAEGRVQVLVQGPKGTMRTAEMDLEDSEAEEEEE